MKMILTMGVFLCLWALVPASVPDVSAQEAKFEIKTSATIADVLKDRIGKRTTIRTQSGEDIEGTVAVVGNNVVHIANLTGKEYYDAVVSIDRISAVIMRVRNR